MTPARVVRDTDIAVIGMACRFPGAASVDEFARNLLAGRESVRTYTDEELRQAGLDPAQFGPHFVRAKAELAGSEEFDAAFFDISAAEAQVIDPQHRIFLQCAWAALEHAGYGPGRRSLNVGVYGGVGFNTYLARVLAAKTDVGSNKILLGNTVDQLVARVAYKLSLHGPTVAIQSACSTALAAVHVAARALIGGECDMALAGGSAIDVGPMGYTYVEGGVLSPDGHCRPFDAASKGTVRGCGAGVVLLKRLADAIADGDLVHAIVRGSAVNNDGVPRIGYTAPCKEGQKEVILSAQAAAEVAPGEIGYIEAHGTATALGDTVELAALKEIFAAAGCGRHRCAIGSVKSNIGHLDAAAGIAGFIKTVLALKHRILFPTVHFTQPNPVLELDQSPFFVSSDAQPWNAGPAPRIAAVSSFGMGGTNAHVILEEAPVTVSSEASGPQVLPFSGRTPEARDAQWIRLQAAVRDEGAGYTLPEIASTLQTGRTDFEHRGFVVATTSADLATVQPTVAARAVVRDEPVPVAFLFPGQGAQRLGMGRELYSQGGAFRAAWTECAAVARDQGVDLDAAVFGTNAEALNETELAQPALFAVEYALARHLEALGVKPVAMIGHSLGEWVAAAIAGVMSPQDAMRLVVARARLMQHAPRGTMLAVPVGPAIADALAADCGLAVAAYNGPESVVLSGPTESIARCEQVLAARRLEGRRLPTSHAFHSPAMAEAAAAFTTACRRVELRAPRIPFVSSLTGQWITAEQAADPAYWGRQLREAVRFDAGLDTLLTAKPRVCLEVGPGRTLGGFALRKRRGDASPTVLATLIPAPPASAGRDERVLFLELLGRLWSEGVAVDWTALQPGSRPRRVPLPSYPFAPTRHWIEAVPTVSGGTRPEDWCYVPQWTEAPAAVAQTRPGGTWIIYADPGEVGESLAAVSRVPGRQVVLLQAGGRFSGLSAHRATVDPEDPADWARVAAAVSETGAGPYTLLCVRTVQPLLPNPSADEAVVSGRGYHDLAHGAHAFASRSPEPLLLQLVTNRCFRVSADEPIHRPERASLTAILRVVPVEYPSVRCRWLDVPWDARGWTAAESAALLAEVRDDGIHRVALRGGTRWQLTEQRVSTIPRAAAPRLTPGGTYLVTGGLNGVGCEVAKAIARETRGTLVLVTRRAMPVEAQWDAAVAATTTDEAVRQAIRAVRAMQADGAVVEIETADLAEFGSAAAALARIGTRHPRIDGLIHSAGTPGGTLVREASPSSARQVAAAKVYGARALLDFAPRCGARFVALFSSLATETGAPGQLDYTASNAFLDALAESAEPGLDVLSIGWDAWAETGMANRAWKRLAGATAGCEGLSNAEGVGAFFSCLERQGRRFGVRKPRSGARAARPTGSGGGRSASEVRRQVTQLLEKALGVSALDPERNFFELGGDSLLAVHLASEINRTFGLAVSVALLFEFPTIDQLAARVAQLLGPAAPARPEVAPAAAPDTPDNSDAIAIIGFSGRFPGSDNLDQFWTHLLGADELVTRSGEPGAAPVGAGDLVSARGRLNDHPGDFDAAFFGYSPGEAELIDPQQRTLLECAWEAMEVAGYDVRGLTDRVGLFAGAGVNSYHARILRSGKAAEAGAAAGFANEKDSLATRAGYHLNLRGPCYSLQTFCSSSLAAVHVACVHLRANECEMALAGGVFLCDPDVTGARYHAGGIFSPDGSCRPFDADAQGTVLGEGVGLVVLKRLSAARRDGDLVHAVIKATACNNDGSAKVSYMAPGVQGQVAVLTRALEQSGVGADGIDFIETHGTGTALGDVAEIAALKQAFRTRAPEAGHCLLGALKANIGHSDAAAGVLGLLKTMQVLKHRLVPPLKNFRSPHPQLGLADSPFAIPTTATPVRPVGRPMRAGLSCFGIGGTNVHCILEEPPEPLPPTPADGPHLFLISARTAAAAVANAHALGTWLEANPAASLADVAHTLATGRHPFRARIAVVATALQDAVRQLAGVTDAQVQLIRGGADGSHSAPSVRADSVDRAALLEGIGAAWCQGHAWAPAERARLFPGHRIVLPTYCFERKRHWIGAGPAGLRAGRQEITDWCYAPSWRKSTSPAAPSAVRTRWFVAGRDDAVLSQLCRELAAQGDCVSVGQRPPEEWPWPATSGTLPGEEIGIVVLAPPLPENGAGGDPFAALGGLSRGRALLERARLAPLPVRITVVTRDAFDLADEAGAGYAQAALTGLFRSAEWECAGRVSGRQIDLAGCDAEPVAAERTARRLARELSLGRDDATVLLRGLTRWVSCLEPVRFDPSPAERPGDGICVVIGGTGNVGSGLAEAAIARGYRHLLVLGREPLDAGRAAGAVSLATARKRERLEALRALGATVEYAAVDVADADALAAAFAAVEQNGVPIRSVVHAAGLVGPAASALIADWSEARWRAVAAGKIDGLPALARAIGPRTLDFCLVVSSLSAVTGGYGFGLYAAAANLMDGFVARQNAEGRFPWIGLNLDNVGDATPGGTGDPLAISRTELKQLVQWVLAERVGARIVVSTRRLETTRPPLPDLVRPDVPPTPAPLEAVGSVDERALIERVWCETLGIGQIGPDEDFFDLGGNSLLAIRVASRLAQELGVPLGLSEMFKYPTIAALTASVRAVRGPALLSVQGEL